MSPENEVPSEDALFDNAVDDTQSPAPPEPAPAPPPAPPVEQPPPEQPKPDTLTAKPEGDIPEDDAAMVPASRIRGLDKLKRAAEAERDSIKAELAAARRERDRIDFERQEFQRRLQAQPQPEAPKPNVPDPLLDPDGYRNYMESRFEERLANERREFSLQSARKTYRDEFDQAYEAARQLVDPGLRARMQQSADPGETLMAWFRELKFRHEVGPDPAAYKKRLRDEALKDPEFRKVAMEAWRGEASAVGASGRPNISLAPSLNGVSRSNAALRASQADLPDDDLWDATTTT